VGPRSPTSSSIASAKTNQIDAPATRTAQHEFWPCDRSLLDETRVDRTRVHGPKQVTDVYLLALAVARGGRFVTFDRTVPISAVAGARGDQLVVL
jgi:hypothetical protein